MAVGGWWLAVDSWWSLGAVLNKKKYCLPALEIEPLLCSFLMDNWECSLTTTCNIFLVLQKGLRDTVPLYTAPCLCQMHCVIALPATTENRVGFPTTLWDTSNFSFSQAPLWYHHESRCHSMFLGAILQLNPNGMWKWNPNRKIIIMCNKPASDTRGH